jgi:hypothetical protein
MAPPKAEDPGAAGATRDTSLSRRESVSSRIKGFVVAVREGDDEMVETALVSFSQSRRWLGPLALVVSGFVMLFVGLKLLVTNWRLSLVQVLPAMWIWFAMLDLKAHALHGHGFEGWKGPIVLLLVLAIAAITAVSFYLNAVFAFAVAAAGPPEIRPAFTKARAHRRVILAWGAGVGLALGFASIVVPRWGLDWFDLAMGLVIGVMMFCYVAIPSKLLGLKKADTKRTPRETLAASAVGGAVGAVICTPPYVIGRIGILLLGSNRFLFVIGIILLALGLTLQAGATGSVKAIKMSAKFTAGRPLTPTATAG